MSDDTQQPQGKRERGRPPHVVTDKDRRQVRVMAAMGIPHEDIAHVLGMHRRSLGRHFAHELQTAGTEANAKVAQSLYQQATSAEKPNVVAAIFWLKCRAGWREKDEEEAKTKRERTAEA